MSDYKLADDRRTFWPVTKTWLRDKAGLNYAVGFGLLSRLWSLPASFVTWYLMLTEFSDVQRGLYSIFQSILAIQIFFELGLSTCLTQFISHEFGNIRKRAEGTLEGDPLHLGRMASVFRLAVKWYSVVAVGFLFFVGVLGWWFLSSKPTEGVSWLIPWWALCAAASFALICNPLACLLEGCGEIAFVAKVRFVGNLVASVLAWFGIKEGLGLMTAAILLALPNAIFLTCCLSLKKNLFRQMWKELLLVPISWKIEIWPFQWRIALSAGSGFFILWFFNIPVVYYWGLEAAGRMGFTNQLVNSLSSVAFMWVAMRAPRYGAMVGQHHHKELMALHRRTAGQSLSVYLVGSAALFGAFLMLQKFPLFAAKLLPSGEAAVLLVAGLATQVVFSQAVLLRAHKDDPFFLLSVLNALLTAPLMIVLTQRNGTLGTCLAYAIVQWLILIPATRIFREFFQKRG